jgi:hypothetical protein
MHVPDERLFAHTFSFAKHGDRFDADVFGLDAEATGKDDVNHIVALAGNQQSFARIQNTQSGFAQFFEKQFAGDTLEQRGDLQYFKNFRRADHVVTSLRLIDLEYARTRCVRNWPVALTALNENRHGDGISLCDHIR